MQLEMLKKIIWGLILIIYRVKDKIIWILERENTLLNKNLHMKKNIWYICGICLFLFIGCIRLGDFYDEMKLFRYRNEEIIKLETIAPISNKKDWYTDYSIIAHSGGGIDDKTYTNSKEAWEYSYNNGTRIFDADLSFTSDQKLVLRHEWYDDLEQPNISEEEIPSYEEFMSTLIFQKYTPMSAYDMLCFMESHDDCYVACDFKNEIGGVKSLIALVKEYDMEQVMDRIIISFYDYEDYFEIKQLYNFENWAIRQYENSPHNYYELAKFCVENDIPVCMVKTAYLDEGDNIQVLTDKGIQVWAAVVNDIDKAKDYKEMGVTGFVSDFIYEKDIER